MVSRVYLSLVLLSTSPVWSQIGSIPFETPARTSDEDRMYTPASLIGDAYPTKVGSQTRSNFVYAGLTLATSYNDNVFVSGSGTPTGDASYSISTAIALDQKTPRQELTFSYSPGYSFYHHTSELNAPTQKATLKYDYRLSQHTTIRVRDFFEESPDVFNQLYPPSGPGEFGSAPSQSPAVFATYANRLNNNAVADITYQFSRNGMIGAGGLTTVLNYSNPSEATGFYNSNSHGGSAFYNRRLSSSQYAGVIYQYVRSQSNPVDEQTNSAASPTTVQTHTISGFYTIYFNPAFSLSLSSGPQYSDVLQSPLPPVHSWAPSVRASIGWQGRHTNFVARYSRTVTGGLGLSGAFTSYDAEATASWQMARTWTTELTASYVSYKNAAPLLSSSSSNDGNTLWGTISLRHELSEQLMLEFRYSRFQQSNDTNAAILAAPGSNNGAISISYRLRRPLGR
jgi:hypothetical protein